MISIVKQIYRTLKYSLFTTRDKEYLNYHKRRSNGLIKDYIDTNEVKKLQIGAQSNLIIGWLNVDIHPKTEYVAYLDATKNFPIGNEVFDFIFNEHMIEHISFEEAEFMLGECYRILKPGGKIRIATPNLNAVVKIFNEPTNSDHDAYIKFYIEKFYTRKLPVDSVFVLNKMFYDFGHKFIHTESSLTYILKQAGFKNIVRFGVGKSDNKNLENIELHWKEIGILNNEMETLILQADK